MLTVPFAALTEAQEEPFEAFEIEGQKPAATRRAGRSVLYAAGILLPIGYTIEETTTFAPFEIF